MCTINEDDIWCLKYKMRQTEIFNILGHFCPFSPLTTWKIKILTLKKTPGDIIILHISIINDNHMMYGSWDIEHNRQFFVILTVFYTLLPHYGPRKSKFSKKWKKHLRYYHFTNINDSHMMYGSSDMEFLVEFLDRQNF